MNTSVKKTDYQQRLINGHMVNLGALIQDIQGGLVDISQLKGEDGFGEIMLTLVGLAGLPVNPSFSSRSENEENERFVDTFVNHFDDKNTVLNKRFMQDFFKLNTWYGYGGNSPIKEYMVLDNSFKVRYFNDNVYHYTVDNTSLDVILSMKQIVLSGEGGLQRYINRSVKPFYRVKPE